ncbi:MAG: hypothetical protein K6G28_06935 [Acholeplasmatales bacterium]|nr:hypothetical protein [Acholeplasmatales bacterium]
MKRILKCLAVSSILAIVGISTSCSKKYNIESSMELTATATTIAVKANVNDPDKKINAKSVRARVIEIASDESESTKTTLTFSKLLTTENEVVINNETQTATSLEVATKYRVELYATVDGESYSLASDTITTSAQGTSENDPISITTYEEFKEIANDYSAYYRLDADINFGDQDYSQIFSSDSKAFKGTFDGNGHKITFKQTESNQYLGLFGIIDKEGTVKNLDVVNANIAVSRSSNTFVGLVAGLNKGTISNVKVYNEGDNSPEFNINATLSGTTSSLLTYVGGIVGHNDADATIENSSINANIKSTIKSRTTLGGVVGTNNGKIKNTKAVNNITFIEDTSSSTSTTVLSYEIGGFVGSNSGIISNSISQGLVDVSFKANASNSSRNEELIQALGGFAGSSLNGTINNSVANTSLVLENEQGPVMYVGAFVGNASIRILDDSHFKNNVVIAKNNKITLDLIKKESDWKIKTKDSDDKEVEIDRIFKFGLINTSSKTKQDSFNEANSFYVIGEFTYTLDDEVDTLPYSISNTDLSHKASTYELGQDSKVIDYIKENI